MKEVTLISDSKYPTGQTQRLKALLTSGVPRDHYLEFMRQSAEGIAKHLQHVDLNFSFETWIKLAQHNNFLQSLRLNDDTLSNAQQSICRAIISANDLTRLEQAIKPLYQAVFNTEDLAQFSSKDDDNNNNNDDINPNDDTILASILISTHLHPQLLPNLASTTLDRFFERYHEWSKKYPQNDDKTQHSSHMLQVLITANPNVGIPNKNVPDINQSRTGIFGSLGYSILSDNIHYNNDSINSNLTSLFYLLDKADNISDAMYCRGKHFRVNAQELRSITNTKLGIDLLGNYKFTGVLNSAQIHKLAHQQHFSFMVKAIQLAQKNKLPQLAEKDFLHILCQQKIGPVEHDARAICVQTDDTDSALAALPKIEQLTQEQQQEAISNWLIARLLVEGLKSDINYLVTAADLLNQKAHNDLAGALLLQLSNEMYAKAFQEGHATAGMKLADNLYTGHGILMNRDNAIKIYAFQAKYHPKILTIAAIDRLIEYTLPNIEHELARYQNIHSQVISCSNYVSAEKPPENLIPSCLSDNQSTLFSAPKVSTEEKLQTLQKNAQQTANKVFKQLQLITDLDLADKPEAQQLLSVQSAHMLMVHILIEQKDCIPKSQWLACMQKSMSYAWDFDQQDAGDPILKSTLRNFKEMYHGDISTAINSKKVELFLESRAQNVVLQEQAEPTTLQRSNSAPLLTMN